VEERDGTQRIRRAGRARLAKAWKQPRWFRCTFLLPHGSDSGTGESAKHIPFALSVSCCAVTAAFTGVGFDGPPLGTLPAMAALVSLRSRDVFKICLCLK
jgi:hypothetical protein